METQIRKILGHYGFRGESCQVTAHGTGLINRTWMVRETESGWRYILQRINHAVFKSPEAIAGNIREISTYLQAHAPGYLFESPLRTLKGEEMVQEAGEYFRLYRYVEGSHTLDVVANPGQAYEASRQFGMFTAQLAGFDTGKLRITLADFHNLPLRYAQYREAIKKGNPERILRSKEILEALESYSGISDQAQQLGCLPLRVIHHDTKISNILFDEQGKGMCVIDLDTIMPGYYISDAGDMMRTYLSPISEEEPDNERHAIRMEIFEAIAEGYLGEMGRLMQDEERQRFVYSGSFMIYMQALRFITDYLNNDVYYGSRYEGHNLVRGTNQLVLLQKYTEKADQMQKIVREYFRR
ncbi:phosphotransferase enzyme family protein [Microbacter margulisiae]|uniref:Ser/Thr protein kinase RdoA (MazF antagonist) n=1 Tax=Microbacter margulisiae TaxID=1350067 RepID=A0A7W5DTB9_9PORP|nr:aminoglycoside phosphotransferase family protein [Microbacter margulisiae]MBB3188714.1 Ser/Thr protein kinase RdoA (MazF antagonist) [Microbacter margulisiae]